MLCAQELFGWKSRVAGDDCFVAEMNNEVCDQPLRASSLLVLSQMVATFRGLDNHSSSEWMSCQL